MPEPDDPIKFHYASIETNPGQCISDIQII